jgi:hypothetical protein
LRGEVIRTVVDEQGYRIFPERWLQTALARRTDVETGFKEPSAG